jgi:hypothetical protein
MQTLKFICPAKGVEVDTGIEFTVATLNLFGKHGQLLCPYCPEPHTLGEVEAWLAGERG